jgi:hypothetical protein
MRLKAKDAGCRTIEAHQFRVLTVIGPYIQNNREITGLGKKCSQEEIFSADDVVAVVLDAETSHR